ncbi:MAG: UDP-N-acetylglucosamine 1-carboxyvinyltransferase [Patescibacteria group bacterium]|nr:UDP-N-acetylglucosamine 1-carboxyvinyltransferase [Patescibacteria group bacterium]
MQERFVIGGLAGRKTLKGELPVRGAKNAILKALPASVLFEDTVVLTNVPDIEDAERMGELVRASGATVERSGSTITITPPPKWRSELEHSIAERIRASIVLTGPMLARTGSVHFPYPGGCVLGERPIDLFLQGFTAMGATVKEDAEGVFNIHAHGGVLLGAEIFFPFISVTATETLMLAAVLAKGETILENAAMEPEIPALAAFLNACGAHIEGAGTSTIRIQGTAGKPLRAEGRPMAMPPDRIEAGSFVILAALAGEDVTITDCEPKHIDALLTLLSRAGVPLEIGERSIRVRSGAIPNERYKSVVVRTHEYPGFPTDLQSPMTIFLTQTTGEVTVLETVFDGRLRYAEDLIRMGADITIMNPHRILIRGPRKLSRKELEGPDLRAGLAYILAASVAVGTSIVNNAYVIDRGYEKIEERLRAIGLSIRRELTR